MSAVDSAAPITRQFGQWRFNTGTGDLANGSSTTRLEPRVARLLEFFLAHQGRLISRDELMTAVWEDRIVSDHAVNRCISILRQTLSPDNKNAYIETVVRRGFISHFPPAQAGNPDSDAWPESEPVEPVQKAKAFDWPEVDRRRRRPDFWRPAALLVLLILSSWLVHQHWSDITSPHDGAGGAGPPMVAVLPFISEGMSGDSAFFANGVHDDLLTQLAQLQSLRVISRTSVAEYRESATNIREIGRQLGADAILEGGVQRVGDQIRINVQLIDVESDAHLWADQYDRKLTPANIFDIQSEIARSIASAMHFTLTPEDAAQLEVIPTDNMAAYRAYHEAMELRNTETIALPAYIAALERAVTLDPEFVRAWAELAGSLGYINMPRLDPESIQRLERILERIRALAPQSPEYLIAQSYYVYYILKDHDRAFGLVQQAHKLRPSDPQILELKSWIQRRQGNIDGAIETLRQARTLDPRNAYWTSRVVGYLVIAHRYDEATEELKNTPFDRFRTAYLQSFLQVRDHGQPARLLNDLTALQIEFGVELSPFDLWEAHIAARDFAGASALLDELRMADSQADNLARLDFPGIHLAEIINEQLRGAGAGSSPAEARAKFERELELFDFKPNVYLARAYSSAAAKDLPETERLVRTWFRESTKDLAERVMRRHHACRALAMATATSAAIDCLRSGFEEPSQAHRFIEPFLPYYDAIRNDPLYLEFLAELRQSAGNDAEMK